MYAKLSRNENDERHVVKEVIGPDHVCAMSENVSAARVCIALHEVYPGHVHLHTCLGKIELRQISQQCLGGHRRNAAKHERD